MTGVQTCALPIYTGGWDWTEVSPGRGRGAASPPWTGFWDGWDRWAPYLAVIYTGASSYAGGLGASSLGAGSAGNVFRIGYSVFKVRAAREKDNPLTL